MIFVAGYGWSKVPRLAKLRRGASSCTISTWPPPQQQQQRAHDAGSARRSAVLVGVRFAGGGGGRGGGQRALFVRSSRKLPMARRKGCCGRHDQFMAYSGHAAA